MRVRRTSGLGWLALASATVAAVTHLLRTFTPAGQRWDDDAYIEALLLPEALSGACNALLGALSIPAIAATLLACLVIALVRHQGLAGIVAVAAFGAAVVSAEVLAIAVPRPDLASDLTIIINNAGANTFPSGHATIATGLSLALITVSAPRWRPWVAGPGLAFTIIVACSTVLAGWHRPSDAVGGIALATAWLSLGSWVLALGRGIRAQVHSSASLVVAVLVCGGLALAAAITLASSVSGGFGLAFLTAQALIVAAACAAVATYALCLRDIDFSRHSR